MMSARLASHLQVAALRKRAEAEGAFATVLRKGDPVSGSILIIRREKGGCPTLFERFLSLSDHAEWVEADLQHADKEQYLVDYLDRRYQGDPDIWVLELDVPFAERFTDIVGTID